MMESQLLGIEPSRRHRGTIEPAIELSIELWHRAIEAGAQTSSPKSSVGAPECDSIPSAERHGLIFLALVFLALYKGSVMLSGV